MIRPADPPPLIRKLYEGYGYTGVKISRKAQCSEYDKCEAGDVVALGRVGDWVAAEINHFVDAGEHQAFLCARKFRCVLGERTYSRWSDTGELLLAPLSSVLHVFVHCKGSELTVLHPYGI